MSINQDVKNDSHVLVAKLELKERRTGPSCDHERTGLQDDFDVLLLPCVLQRSWCL